MIKKTYFLILIALLFSCKSTKTTTDSKLDITKLKSDNTITNSSTFSVDFSLDEMIIDIYEPSKKTIITDNNGNIKTFTNVKTITTKKKKESVKQDSLSIKKDIKDVIVDKSNIKTNKESISDAVQYKWIFISLAIIACCFIIWRIFCKY